MSPNRMVALVATFLSLTLGLATSAQAVKFSVTGGGAQLHIGNGLALPIQAAVVVTGTVFPTLLIPVKGVPTIEGTIAKPLLTAMSTMGATTKVGYQRKLSVPVGVLEKNSAQKTVGVKFSNPLVYAVGTNLKYNWPNAPAVFSVSQPLGATVVSGFGGTLTYSNALGSRFGGAAQFAISQLGGGPGLNAAYPVTVYLKVGAGTPPCTHTLLGGVMSPANAACVAGIIYAAPTGVGAAGGTTMMTVMTPGVVINPNPNVAAVKMGMTPNGTLLAPALLIANNPGIPTNMAQSQPGPWTTGQVIISNPAAMGGAEKFTLEGKDSRTAAGGGTIQMVTGTVSARPASGANANRGWLRLTLAPQVSVPSMSWVGLSATVGLIVIAFGYTMRRRIFA